MNETNNQPGRKALRTFLIIVGLFLIYAIAVQVTEINVGKLEDSNRLEQVIGVLRFLADPDLTEPGMADIVMGGQSGSGLSLMEVTRNTMGFMVETIFMALMATTIGTLLAIPLSFLAARNLMMEITSPLAAIMFGLILLPVGALAGLWLTRPMLSLADAISGQPTAVWGALILVVVVVWAISRWGLQIIAVEERPVWQQAAAGVQIVLLLALLFFGLGLLANIGHEASEWLTVNLGVFGFLGDFTRVLSDLIDLALAPIVSLLAGLAALSFGSKIGQEGILRVAEIPGRILTAVLTVGGTAVLVFAVGSALNWLYLFDNPENWTTRPALILGMAAGLGSLFLSPKRPFAVGGVMYTISRAIFNILRSIEPLIMAVVFVVWVGLGPFAGVMALTLHTIAALGKLYSEQIEGISEGPIEAIIATGANRLQMVVFGVIPQIVPPYTAYTLYRWDINVRMSTIIGFVGGGGVGFLLSQSIRLLRYRDASVMMLAIAIVVSALDYISSKVRTRII